MPPSVANVTDGLAKLIREVRLLQREVAELHNSLKGFTGGERLRQFCVLPTEAGGGSHAMPVTPDPRSAITQIIYEFPNNANLDIPTRTLRAIAKELDGALRDIRAARHDIEAIADDSDLRESFKEWQETQKKR